MDDDFNTAQALGHVFDMVRLTNNFIVDEKHMPDYIKAEILAEAKKYLIILGQCWEFFKVMPTNFLCLIRKPNYVNEAWT